METSIINAFTQNNRILASLIASIINVAVVLVAAIRLKNKIDFAAETTTD